MKTIILSIFMLYTLTLTSKIKAFTFKSKASWYGNSFHGRLSANGEIYNQNKYTAASPFLPFGTILKITNLDNKKVVWVRINDRGPFKLTKHGKLVRPLQPHPNRALDLSKKAFSTIASLKTGVVRISYEIINRKTNPKQYTLLCNRIR